LTHWRMRRLDSWAVMIPTGVVDRMVEWGGDRRRRVGTRQPPAPPRLTRPVGLGIGARKPRIAHRNDGASGPCPVHPFGVASLPIFA
jgi:hypothetical protein